MAKLNVRITEDGGDVSIYTEVHKIEVNKDKIHVDYEDKNAQHHSDLVDEVIIELNPEEKL